MTFWVRTFFLGIQILNLDNDGAVKLVADLDAVAVDDVADDAPRPEAAPASIDHQADEPRSNH